MANLFDDYKNMIPGGIWIRDGVVTVPNNDNAIMPLDLYEIVICEKLNISNARSITLYFNQNVTQYFIIFNVPLEGSTTANYSGTTYVENRKRLTNENLVNNNTIELFPQVYYNNGVGDDVLFTKGMRWLILRIS